MLDLNVVVGLITAAAGSTGFAVEATVRMTALKRRGRRFGTRPRLAQPSVEGGVVWPER
jgi:hypothetical protein